MKLLPAKFVRMHHRNLVPVAIGILGVVSLLAILIISKIVWHTPHGSTRPAAEISAEQLRAVQEFESALADHLQKLDTIGQRPVLGTHGPAFHSNNVQQKLLQEAATRAAQYQAETASIATLPLPTVADDDSRWYIASARMALQHYADLLRADAAAITSATVDSITARYYYPFERQHRNLLDARDAYSENSLRVYRNFGYDLNSIDKDSNRLKPGAVPQKKTTFDRD